MPVKFGLDTSYLIPLIAEWHQHHEQTARDYRARLARGERPVVAIHALLECYSVLTRLPYPTHIPSQVAAQILTQYLKDVEVAGVTPDTAWLAIRSLAALDLGGGRIYDALIATTVVHEKASLLMTWNVKHFLALAPPGLEIRQP
ncbi:MAG: PIN domain-containing protein [Acidobacteriia bacterium]|nr:PIN domain-containing protein [Terriglobia bacterium]